MAAVEQSRISVVRNNEVVPLLPDRHAHERAAQPWNGMLLERHTVRASEIPEHEHRDFCFHLQVAGNSDFEWWSEGRHGVEKTSPGSLILLGPGTRDRLLWQGNSERFILSLDPAALHSVAEELDVQEPPEFVNRWSLDDPGLANLMKEMGREAAAGWPFGTLYAGMLQQNFARHLLQRHAAKPLSLPEVTGRLTASRLRLVFEFIHANLHRDLSLEQIAAHAGLSAFHFAREFRNSTGQAPHQYALDQRIARAKRLLAQKGLSVQEVAFEVGFSSPANFVRAFRQRVGVPPGAWRQRS